MVFKMRLMVRELALLFALLMTVTLSSCRGSTVHSDDNTSDTVTLIKYVIDAKINENKPIYRFTFECVDKGIETEPTDCQLSITDPSGNEIQRFSFPSVCMTENIQVMLADLNFDGYLDLVSQEGHGAHANAGVFNVYCWQENGTTDFEGFVNRPSLEYSGALIDSIERLEETHQLIAYGDGMTCMYQVERADKYSMPEFRLLRYCEYDRWNESPCRFYEQTETEQKLIYECPYFDRNMDSTAQNYLRFGIADPITPEKALRIAAEQYPDRELTLVQMLTFGGESYFQIAWSNENDSGDVGVSVDGTKTIDCSPYLAELKARAVPAFIQTGDTV